MNLVDEDDRLRSAMLAPLARLFHERLDVLDRGARRRERHEARARGPGDDARQRRLSRSRRTPEDHRRDAIGLDRGAEEAPRRQEILEADDLLQGPRTQTFG